MQGPASPAKLRNSRCFRAADRYRRPAPRPDSPAPGRIDGLRHPGEGRKHGRARAVGVQSHDDEYQNFYAVLFDLSPDKILRREAIRLIRLTDRYRALASEVRRPGEHLTAHLEHTLLQAISKRDREQLIHGFERERDKILASMLATIEARSW